MIDIDSAISQIGDKKNISNGGSACFDFGDVVLVRYSCLTKYLRDNERTRKNSEEIMESINVKAQNGVNTPRHLAIKRVVEGEDDVCYVLQEKCPGVNCSDFCQNKSSVEDVCSGLERVLNIPFEHYKKLIIDGCQLFEMGYEAKAKNLFYDDRTGFWYIDFLKNDTDYIFDSQNIVKIFETIKYRIPNLVQLVSPMFWGKSITPEDKKRIDALTFQVKAKTFKAIKEVLPNFTRYEKFFLLDQDDSYLEYLMNNNLTNHNLIVTEESDYEVFQELYEIVMQGLIDKIVNKNVSYQNIVSNDIRNDSNLFNLQKFFLRSRYNNLNKEDFSDEYDYKISVNNIYISFVLDDLISRLKNLDQTESISNFLTADEQYSIRR